MQRTTAAMHAAMHAAIHAAMHAAATSLASIIAALVQGTSGCANGTLVSAAPIVRAA